ncbi:MAG: hypothetical protein ABSE43_16935 [Steroidobacteraceae bacterium]|jgi:hypothetical protein
MLRLHTPIALALLALLVHAPARAQQSDPLADYYGNTFVCAGGLDGDDACHIWLEKDGSFVMFGGMQGGHHGHYQVGPLRSDGQVALCLYLDTTGIDIPPELEAHHPAPAMMPPTGSGAAPAAGAGNVPPGGPPPGAGGGFGCDTVNFRTTCGPGHGKPALDAEGKPLPLARAIIARFHDGMCYPMGGQKLGDHWVETDDPSPSQGGKDQAFLFPGHR